MKQLLLYISVVIVLSGIVACRKETTVLNPSAGLMVANVVVGGETVTLNGNASLTVDNNSFNVFPLLSGQDQVRLVDTVVSPAQSYYDQPIQADDGVNYSLFLTGNSPAAVDAVLIKESYSNYTDSVCGVRFINLSPGSSPVSVNLAGEPNGAEISSLAYKSYGIFKQYPAQKTNARYTFEVRDAATGSLITSYTLNTPYFHNVTLILQGLVGGSPAADITRVLHP